MESFHVELLGEVGDAWLCCDEATLSKRAMLCHAHVMNCVNRGMNCIFGCSDSFAPAVFLLEKIQFDRTS